MDEFYDAPLFPLPENGGFWFVLNDYITLTRPYMLSEFRGWPTEILSLSAEINARTEWRVHMATYRRKGDMFAFTLECASGFMYGIHITFNERHRYEPHVVPTWILGTPPGEYICEVLEVCVSWKRRLAIEQKFNTHHDHTITSNIDTERGEDACVHGDGDCSHNLVGSGRQLRRNFVHMRKRSTKNSP